MADCTACDVRRCSAAKFWQFQPCCSCYISTLHYKMYTTDRHRWNHTLRVVGFHYSWGQYSTEMAKKHFPWKTSFGQLSNQRHKLRDRRRGTTACPPCWAMGTNRVKYIVYGEEKILCTGLTRASKDPLHIYSTHWIPICFSFNSQQRSPLSTLPVSNRQIVLWINYFKGYTMG